MPHLIFRKAPPAHMIRIACLLLVLGTGSGYAVAGPPPDALAGEVHNRSAELRMDALERIVAADSLWPHGAWGDTMWALAALYLNERADEANARLLDHARAQSNVDPIPRDKEGSPWSYFALGDYVRILCLFHSGSDHHPGRLEPETETAMKEALWEWVSRNSRVDQAARDHLWHTRGTENHDLTEKPAFYLVASVLKDDPAYADRAFEDGYTAEAHFNAWNAYYRKWPAERALNGMWIEIGSDTYQKYSYPPLFNLRDLSPDPVVRKRTEMLLDIALIEEAQISVLGRRGGGRSRAGYGGNNFERYKALLYGDQAGANGGTHSRIVETSDYQVPAAAVLLREVEFPADDPFAIVNRVPGERKGLGKDAAQRPFQPDSALVNYAWRTPHYLLGSTLQDPGLSMTDPDTGKSTLKYAGISRQNRWSGILFHELEAKTPADLPAVYPVIEQTRAGRPQHPYWNFQHENVMFLQRIGEDSERKMGSYSTGKIGVRFQGNLQIVERDGWIFAATDSAFVGVNYLDDEYEWDSARGTVMPADHAPDSTTRILFHAGDTGTYSSLEAFIGSVQNNTLTVTPEALEYAGPGQPRLQCFLYDFAVPEDFRLPQVDGNAVNLRPDSTYRSPYLRSSFGDNRVHVRVGSLRKTYDFDKTRIEYH